MQQYSTKEKRKRTAFRYFTYGVMSLAVVAISTLCILLVLGYHFDFTRRAVVQGALVQYISTPSGASVTLDGSLLSFKTPGKSNVDAGKHTVVMKREGYREWSKTMSVSSGELRWLNYARLIPSTVTTSAIQSFKTATSGLFTSDHRWVAVYGAADQPTFTLVDLRDPKNYKSEAIILPANSYTNIAGKPHVFQLAEWDFGGRYLLIKHTVGDTVEYLRWDRTKTAEALNITTKVNLPILNVHFSGTSGNVFYVQNGTNVRRLDVAAATISEPIAANATSFTLYKTDTLDIISDKDSKRLVSISSDDKTPQVIREYDTTQPVMSDTSDYYSDNYVAIARGTSVEIIKNPTDKTSVAKSFASFTLPTSAQWLEFSNGGRFVVAGNGTQFVSYDLETKETFSVNLPGTAADPAKHLQWLDDYILVSNADGNLRLSEFDGANQQVITDVDPALPVTLSDNGKFLYSIAKTTEGYSLQASKLTIE